jgi:hypothetical protein
MLVQETFINETEGYQFGESEPYEPWTDDIGTLFREFQKEYGGCAGKVHIEKSNGEIKDIGWVFSKKQQYTDSDDWYTREVWVVLLDKEPETTVKYSYHYLN